MNDDGKMGAMGEKNLATTSSPKKQTIVAVNADVVEHRRETWGVKISEVLVAVFYDRKEADVQTDVLPVMIHMREDDFRKMIGTVKEVRPIEMGG